MIQLGQVAPDFEAETTHGPIRFHDWLGNSWGVLFSRPKDFTPVCTTELGETARLKPDFDKRGVEVIGVSADPLDRHAGWEADTAETQGHAVNFPMIADPDKRVARLYGMVHPEADPSITDRIVFGIDPQKPAEETAALPRLPAEHGAEFRRGAARHRQPAADRPRRCGGAGELAAGERGIIPPSIPDEPVKTLFPKAGFAQGWQAKRPYLRYVGNKVG
jgi:alkyl hydroperoxide reductase subunit AhpC